MPQMTLHSHRQTLPDKFIDHVQDPKRSAIVGSFEHEVIAPDMVRKLRFQPQTGSIVQPQATPFRLSGRYLQPFPTPDALHTLVVHLPPLVVQESGDAAIAITSILAGQFCHTQHQALFFACLTLLISLCRTRLSKSPADPSFRKLEHFLGSLHRLPASVLA